MSAKIYCGWNNSFKRIAYFCIDRKQKLCKMYYSQIYKYTKLTELTSL